jgi:hypothetical protein
MKKTIVILSFLLFTTALYSQKKIEVRDGKENIGGASNHAFVVNMHAHSKEEIEKAWRSKMKDIDGKTSTKKSEIFADDCKMKSMGPNTFDVYARVEESKDQGYTLIVGVDLGGAYLNASQHNEQYKIFKNFLHEFAVKVAKDAIGDDLKTEEKKLSKLEDQQKDLERDNKKLKEDIENYKKKITQAEEDIKQNEEQQKKKKEEIESQKKVVKEVEEKAKAIK